MGSRFQLERENAKALSHQNTSFGADCQGKTVRNDRLLGLAFGEESDAISESVQLDNKLLRQIEYFFISYNQLDGKKFRVLGKASPQSARAILRKAVKRHRKKKSD